MEDGEGEFDPLLDDEDDDEESVAGRRNSRAGVQGGYNLLYIGSLKVRTSLLTIRVGSSITDHAFKQVSSKFKQVSSKFQVSSTP